MRFGLIFVLLIPGGCFFNALDPKGAGLELADARVVQAVDWNDTPVLTVTKLATLEQQRLSLLDLGVLDAPSSWPQDQVTSIVASSSGKLAIARFSGEIAVLSTTDFRLLSRENTGFRTMSLAWSADGSELAIVRARTGGVVLDIRDESLAEIRTVELDSDSVPSDAGPYTWYASWAPAGERFVLSWTSAPVLADGTCVIFDITSGAATSLPITRAFFVSDDVIYANNEQAVSQGPRGALSYGPLRVSRVTLRDSGPEYEPVPGGEFVNGSDPSSGIAVVAVRGPKITLNPTPFTALRLYDVVGQYSQKSGTLGLSGYGAFFGSIPMALLP